MLTREPVGRSYHLLLSLRKGGGAVSTYEEFQIIISVAMLIIAILNYNHKK